MDITITCPPEAVEAASYALLEAGCSGTQLEMRGDGEWQIKGYLPLGDELMPRIDALSAHLRRFPEFGLPSIHAPISLRPIEEADWAEAWKQHFKPMRIGKRLVVKPHWENVEIAPHELLIELDPGMAFGTGAHPTTRLCLEAIEKYLCPGMRVADIGTGSGILALAAAKLGAVSVLATDIDSLPRQIAAENVAKNHLENHISILAVQEFYETAHNCNLVMANIVANTLVEIAADIARICAPEALLIASGVVQEHEHLVWQAFKSAGFAPVETTCEDVWVCLIARYQGALINSLELQRIAQALPPLNTL